MKKISLNKLLQLKNINIIDVRNNTDFNKFNIYGSINIPYLDIYNNYKLYLDKSKTYYIICESGYTSKKIVKFLFKQNYNVIHVKKGIEKLIKSNL